MLDIESFPLVNQWDARIFDVNCQQCQLSFVLLPNRDFDFKNVILIRWEVFASIAALASTQTRRLVDMYNHKVVILVSGLGFLPPHNKNDDSNGWLMPPRFSWISMTCQTHLVFTADSDVHWDWILSEGFECTVDLCATWRPLVAWTKAFILSWCLQCVQVEHGLKPGQNSDP